MSLVRGSPHAVTLTSGRAIGIMSAEEHEHYMMRNAPPLRGNRLLMRHYTMINHGIMLT